jgi:tRNA(Ile)-lysidine synthase
MVPFGMRGKKKISDIFADMKWHQAQKKDAVIIAVAEDYESSESRVAGLLGVRMDDAYRISDSTTVIVRIRKQ